MNHAPATTPDALDPSPSPWSEFLAGAKETFPLIVGAIPFGIIFGTLALSSGLSFLGAMAMSAFVFAGSAQFIALGLLAAGTAWPVIILTTFVVNLRHALYSASLAPYVRRLPRRWQSPLAFWLTDETFAVVIDRYTKSTTASHTHWYFLGSALFMYTNWQLCTFLGLTIGQLLPNAAELGLDFAMPVTFIGLVIAYLKHWPMVATVIVSGSVALVAFSLPHNLGLIVASLAGILTGILIETFRGSTKKRSTGGSQ
jgi:4-azaleucine resistance transporter AzlC